MRGYITLIFTGLFIIGVAGLASIPNIFWRQLEWWQTALYILPVISGLCIIFLSVWVSDDKIEIDSLKNDVEWLKEKLHKLEKEIPPVS